MKLPRFVDKLGRKSLAFSGVPIATGLKEVSISTIRFSYIFLKADRLPIYKTLEKNAILAPKTILKNHVAGVGQANALKTKLLS